MATIRKFGEEWLVMDTDDSFLGTIYLNDDGEYHAKRIKHFLGSYQRLDDAVEAIVAYNNGD